MTYKTWMKRNYYKDRSPKGDLARDLWTDEKFPMNRACKFAGWHDLILKYLDRQGACDGAIDAFEESWKEYVACVKR